MAYVIPTFNLTANVWNFPAAPPGPVSFTTLCNLAFSRRVHPNAWNPAGPGVAPIFGMYLLLPALTDVRDPFNGAGLQSIFEVPAGSGRFYEALDVDDAGKGFANEHRVVAIKKSLGPWPIPIP